MSYKPFAERLASLPDHARLIVHAQNPAAGHYWTLPVATITAGEYRQLAAAPALYEALNIMVAEKADYMRINSLGDPEEQHSIKLARKALSLSGIEKYE